MAHLIENNEIAYVGQKPWHGLGTEVVAGTSGADMLKAAGLDWLIEKRTIALANTIQIPTACGKCQDRPGFDGVGRPCLYCAGTGFDGMTEGNEWNAAPVNRFAAITRSDNDRVFQIAGEKYHPVQNLEIVEFFREYCEAGNAVMETVGGLRGGAVVWALAKLSGAASRMIGGSDAVNGYMLLATSHDGSLATVGRPTQVRVVCNNTLGASLRGGNEGKTFRMAHCTKFDETAKQDAREVMGFAIEQVAATNDMAERFSKIKMSQEDRIQYIARLLNKDALGTIERAAKKKTAFEKDMETDNKLSTIGRGILEAMIDSPGSHMLTAKDTLWGAINGVTYFSDHTRGKDQDGRLSNSWFGTGNKLKNDAVQAALEMAGVSA